MTTNYYDRTDPTKEYESHLFVSGRGLQSAELNEIQTASRNRIQSIADALFKDGDVIRDAQIIVNPTTGVTTCQSGALYLRGAVRGIAPASLTIPVVGTVAVGVRLIETVVTSTEDADLVDPADLTHNFQLPGADRKKVHTQWGWFGDGATGQFYPVYTVIDGYVNAKEAPPNLDAFSQALARYDRDSAGGTYIVTGLQVKQMDDVGGNQVYTMAEGRARVYGSAIEFMTSRRLTLAAVPDLKAITNEPHLSTTVAAQRIDFDRTPGTNITEVTITAEKTVTLVHGVTTGAQDPLPDTSVLQILEVKQGGTTYTVTADYKLTAGKVDWSPTGAEPAPGSSYTVKYQYILNVTPTAVDDNGFTVTGAVVGTQVQVSYSQKLPRIDRLCLTQEGATTWLQGVSAEWSPQPPAIPVDLLPIASVFQTWTTTRRVTNDGVRVVPMPVLAAIDNRIDLAMQLIAQNRLESSIHTRESGTKLGLFTDPFIDDSQRDAGVSQTAAIVRGELLLPIAATISPVNADISSPTTCSYNHVTALEQPLRTGSMNINPYMAFDPVPASVKLTPSVDRWTQVVTDWASATTSRFVVGSENVVTFNNAQWANSSISQTTRNALISTTTSNVETLRSIEVHFEASGFGVGEAVQTVTFDGIVVTATAP